MRNTELHVSSYTIICTVKMKGPGYEANIPRSQSHVLSYFLAWPHFSTTQLASVHVRFPCKDHIHDLVGQLGQV